jgi:ATP dependent DNA ligase C terminal region
MRSEIILRARRPGNRLVGFVEDGPPPGSRSDLRTSRSSSSAVHSTRWKPPILWLIACRYYGPEGLLFAGRVGTGFSERALATLYEGLERIKLTTCPFVLPPERRHGRWGVGITPAVFKRCTWVEPILVAEIKFTEWTSDDQLRQPVFLALRSDKDPKEVVRE